MHRISLAGARNARGAHHRGVAFSVLVAFLLLSCTRAPSTSGPSSAVDVVQWRSEPLTQPPGRCVPANAGLVDMLVALVEPGRIVAIPAQADSWSILAESSPFSARFDETPRFERYVAERVLAHRPDLVLVDPFNAPETTNRLVESGVAVLQVASSPRWEEVVRVLRELGAILGVQERASHLLSALEARRRTLQARAGKRRPLRALAYSNQGAGGFGAADDTTMDEVLRLAGCANVLEGRAGWAPLSFEDLLALEPDVLVISGAPGQRAVAEAVLRETPALRSLEVLRTGRIVRLPPRLFSATSQEMLRAAEVLASAIDAFPVTALGERDR
ncbi:MAG TPA: ABC transporter substrate-binding protein [Planctomycetes bacterium]|nr:ABC transporter substrate-binding protein [Planctomycetota bacterium]